MAFEEFSLARIHRAGVEFVSLQANRCSSGALGRGRYQAGQDTCLSPSSDADLEKPLIGAATFFSISSEVCLFALKTQCASHTYGPVRSAEALLYNTAAAAYRGMRTDGR